MRRSGWIGGLILAAVIFCLAPGIQVARAQQYAVGRVVSVRGKVSVRRSTATQWQPARVGQALLAGDAVRTGPASTASILCIDESQIKLNENTVVILKSIAPSPRLKPVIPAKGGPPPASRYEVPEGEIWLRNKHEKFRFELETPAITAIIRGTELNIKVRRNGATSVLLLEGHVCIANPQGEVCLRPGEEGYAVPGQKPTKRVLVQPADAVQWVLYYPAIISYRDLPLAPQPGEYRTSSGPSSVAPLIREAETAYDQGRLKEARDKAKTVLTRDPQNSRALTLWGWVCLQESQPAEALKYFRQVSQPDDLTKVGQALALEHLGNSAGAYKLIRTAGLRGKPSPLLVAMSGYFALLNGRVEDARSRLQAAVALAPPAPRLARPLLAQIDLVQNRKAAAKTEATQALAQAPKSPMALFTMGLVKLASFQLPVATRYLEKAIAADPHFVNAYVYLAKIWLGSGYLRRAQHTIDQALRLAPRNPGVLSLAGFVRLAFRDYSRAFQYWNRAVALDPKFGQPHLGLAIYSFRYREFAKGLEEMLTATLLDPRVASYQTELGKALFQTRAFNRALEVYDYAKTLDPRDPSPYFYKGIALSDLNRPGEAVQEINKSIELNDNVAMFRSRSLLDQDLAVRNYSLARAYQQLGLTEWAFSKAVTAVKYKPYDSSSHLFLRDVLQSGSEAPFLTTGLLAPTVQIEAVLYRVLSPANQATFSSLQFQGTEALGLTHDYTPMFEMPYARVGAMGSIGVSEGGKSIQDQQAFAYGGIPGAAFETFGRFYDDRGVAPPSDAKVNGFNGTYNLYSVEAAGKWAPTVQGTITGLFQYYEQKNTYQQIINRTNPQGPVFLSSSTDQHVRSRLYEAAYYYRFNPQAALLAYYAHRELPVHVTSPTQSNYFVDLTSMGLGLTPVSQQTLAGAASDQEFNDVQLQSNLVLGDHNLIAGFDYFSSSTSQRLNQTDFVTYDLSAFIPGFYLSQEYLTLFDYQPPFRSTSVYLLDYWRLRQNLVLELGLFKDFSKAPRYGYTRTIYTSQWNPRFGVNYQFRLRGTLQTLRLALERHLTTHLVSQPLLVDSEIAGFPWAITANSGADVRQAGVAWESQWNAKTFTALRLNALRVATPNLITGDNRSVYGICQNWERYQASLVLNRILTPHLGLSLGVLGKRLVPDLSYQPTLESYSEFDAFLGLAFLSRQGWLARIRPLLVQQFGKITGHQAANPFVIVNLTLGREFPNKRGFALFQIQNLFNRTPFYSLEPNRAIEFSTNRRFLFRLGFYF
jgi:tetratricopeptide (TPR) repeat protein